MFLIKFILISAWFFAVIHNDILIDGRLGGLDYSSGWKNWLPEAIIRFLLALILFAYIESAYTWVINKLQK